MGLWGDLYRGLSDVAKALLTRTDDLKEKARIREADAEGLIEPMPGQVMWRRPAAPSAGTRQNNRRFEFGRAFLAITAEFPGEPRAARRRMAWGRAKRVLAAVQAHAE